MHQEFFDLLKKEHKEVDDLLEELEETSDGAVKTREKLFAKLKEELVPHMKAEEKAFYPPLKGDKNAREDALESLQEHHVAELVLKELDRLDKGDEVWGAKLSVFKEIVSHHVEEEESTIFDAARKALDASQMEKIMTAFDKEKQKAKSKLSS
ncbi:MAG: hemerythrin domain-containing protein [Desulfobacterales bacterium]